MHKFLNFGVAISAPVLQGAVFSYSVKRLTSVFQMILHSNLPNSIGSAEIKVFFMHKETRIFGGLFLALIGLDICKKIAMQKVNQHFTAEMQRRVLRGVDEFFANNVFTNEKIFKNKTYSLSKAYDEAEDWVENITEIVSYSLFCVSSSLVTGYLLGNIFGQLLYSVGTQFFFKCVNFGMGALAMTVSVHSGIRKKFDDMQQNVAVAKDGFNNIADAALNEPIKFEQTAVKDVYFNYVESVRKTLVDALRKISNFYLAIKVYAFIGVVYGAFMTVLQAAIGLKLGISPSVEYSLVNVLADNSIGMAISDGGIFFRASKLFNQSNYYSNLNLFTSRYRYVKDSNQSYKYYNTSASTTLLVLESDFRNRVVEDGKITDKVFAQVKEKISFERGNVYAVVGPSGVGKTTFTYALGNFSPTWAGGITANPVLKDRFRMQYCSQDGMTVLRNVPLYQMLTSQIIKAKMPSPERVEQVLRALDLWDKFGKDGRIHKPISNPSGGEQARLLLAKGMLQEAKLIILDETLDKTSDVLFEGQDQSSRQKYRGVVTDYAKQNGAAVICIQQDESTAWADHVITFAKKEGLDEPAIISLTR